jgi:hypothetical protein
MASTVAELIDKSRAAASTATWWLGSRSHLEFLDAALGPLFGASDVTLEWAPPGTGSHWDPGTRVMRLEPPVGLAMPAEDAAELTVLGLLHECFHERFTSEHGDYEAFRDGVGGFMAANIDRLFQRIEDGRIAALGTAQAPSLQPHVDKLTDLTLEAAAATYGASGEGPKPASQRMQLQFALETYALRPDAALVLDPQVAALLPGLVPRIDKGRHGSTDDCWMAAALLVGDIMRSPLPT